MKHLKLFLILLNCIILTSSYAYSMEDQEEQALRVAFAATYVLDLDPLSPLSLTFQAKRVHDEYMKNERNILLLQTQHREDKQARAQLIRTRKTTAKMLSIEIPDPVDFSEAFQKKEKDLCGQSTTLLKRLGSQITFSLPMRRGLITCLEEITAQPDWDEKTTFAALHYAGVLLKVMPTLPSENTPENTTKAHALLEKVLTTDAENSTSIAKTVARNLLFDHFLVKEDTFAIETFRAFCQMRQRELAEKNRACRDAKFISETSLLDQDKTVQRALREAPDVVSRIVREEMAKRMIGGAILRAVDRTLTLVHV